MGGRNKMYIIGLTGGIASGKSTVSTMLAELGAYVIDVDDIAKDVVRPNQPAWHGIVAHFGKGVLLADGTINRVLLGEKIFADKGQRQWLESITHPFIAAKVQETISQAKEIGVNLVVLDVPLLFEAEWQGKVNEIWVVYVRTEIQVARLIARNHLTSEQAKARIASQMNLEEKASRADVLIDNNSALGETREQVEMAWAKIRQR